MKLVITISIVSEYWVQPPSGGCVLKQEIYNRLDTTLNSSRLRAAVC